MLAILEVLWTLVASFQGKLVMENDSLNASSWFLLLLQAHGIFQFYCNEIKVLSSSIALEFKHVGR